MIRQGIKCWNMWLCEGHSSPNITQEEWETMTNPTQPSTWAQVTTLSKYFRWGGVAKVLMPLLSPNTRYWPHPDHTWCRVFPIFLSFILFSVSFNMEKAQCTDTNHVGLSVTLDNTTNEAMLTPSPAPINSDNITLLRNDIRHHPENCVTHSWVRLN